jgi:hypothetical protein
MAIKANLRGIPSFMGGTLRRFAATHSKLNGDSCDSAKVVVRDEPIK